MPPAVTRGTPRRRPPPRASAPTTGLPAAPRHAAPSLRGPARARGDGCVWGRGVCEVVPRAAWARRRRFRPPRHLPLPPPTPAARSPHPGEGAVPPARVSARRRPPPAARRLRRVPSPSLARGRPRAGGVAAAGCACVCPWPPRGCRVPPRRGPRSLSPSLPPHASPGPFPHACPRPCARACVRASERTVAASRARARPAAGPVPSETRPQIRRGDPLNLSILVSGGKETNQDSLSSGERTGKSPAPNPRPAVGRGTCGVRKTHSPAPLVGGPSPSDRGPARGRCEAGSGPRRAGPGSSRSRVAWECSPKRVVNSI